MTIPTQQATQTFLGNGVTTTFNFSFVGDSSSFITVQYTDTSGNVTTLSPSQYTIFLNLPETGALWGIGGTVTYPTIGSPIANGTSLAVTRTLPLTQTTTISNQGNFAPQVIETALDTLEMQVQQVSSRTGLFRGTWATGIFYNYGDYVIDGSNGADTGNYYMCFIANTSGTWATDLAAGDWILVINIQSIEAEVAAAAASAAAAAVSASNAATSATNSANSATSAATSATNSANSATSAATSASAAAVSASQAADYAASYSGTSTSNLAIVTGTKVFTTQASKLWVNGQYLQIASNAGATNYMHGTVTSYSGTTLTMDITDIGGTGTHADWNISISGTQGPTGSGAAFNTISSGTNTTAAMVVGSGASLAPTGTGTITGTALTSASTTINVSSATAPSVNQVLMATSSTTATWQYPGNTLLSTQTAIGSSAVIFDSTLITSTYKEYILEYINLTFSSNGANVLIRVSENNGSAIQSTNKYGGTAFGNNQSTMVTAGNNANSTDGAYVIVAGDGVSNTSTQPFCGTTKFYNPAGTTTTKVFNSIIGYEDSTAKFAQEICSYQYTGSTNAINWIEVIAQTGTITGIIKLYGVA